MAVGGMVLVIVLAIVAIVFLLGIIVYSVRLQRRAVSTQTAVVDDHFAEKTQRQRHLDLAEESLREQKGALARDEEALKLLRTLVALNEKILEELRKQDR